MPSNIKKPSEFKVPQISVYLFGGTSCSGGLVFQVLLEPEAIPINRKVVTLLSI
jgi:hypothetical protein